MARSRSTAWLRDELILALDLYRREGRNPAAASVTELSHTLRSIPIEIEKADEPGFRNLAGVYLKVANFVAIDPEAETAGMSRGGRGDLEVFNEFWGDPDRLTESAAAIRSKWGFHLTGVRHGGVPPRSPGPPPLQGGRASAGAGWWTAPSAGLGIGDDLAVADRLMRDGELEHAVEDEPAAA